MKWERTKRRQAGSHGTLPLSLSFKAPSLNFELWMPAAAAARLPTTTRMRKKKALLFLPHFHALRYCDALQGREQASQAFYFLFHFFIFRCLQLNHATLRGGEDLLTSYPGPCLEFELIPKLSHLEEVHVGAKQSHAIPNADCSFFFQVPPGNKSARRRTRRTTTKMRRRPLACRPPSGTMPQRWRLRLLQAQKW